MVVFVGIHSNKLLQSAIGDRQPGIAEVIGPLKCHYADLVVVDDLSRICTCPDAGSLQHTLAISALGRPVITKASWVLAQCRVVQVPPESVLRHVPLLGKIKVVFEGGRHHPTPKKAEQDAGTLPQGDGVMSTAAVDLFESVSKGVLV